MLTGQNGILNRAAEAKEKTGVAKEDESQKLKGYEDTISQYSPSSNGGSTGGGSEGGNPTGGSLPKGTGTTPYLPNSTFSKKEGDLATGLVIKDSNDNEYVWVEVPTTIYSDSKYNTKGIPSSAEDWKKIRDCLKAYTADYLDSSDKDTNTDETTYLVEYKNMLKSVYTNGGFWIGRYEAGLEEGKDPRKSYVEISESEKAVIKPNMYPYNYITRDEAQTMAQKMNYGDCKGSLIFVIQWDLTLKYIEEKTVEAVEEANKDKVRTDIKRKLTSDSTEIGNYYNSAFILNRGKFAQDNALAKWYNFNSEEKPTLVTGSKRQSLNTILLTTGATEATNLQNIYDIAGNVREWILDPLNDTSDVSVSMGGGCFSLGDDLENRAKDCVIMCTDSACYNTYGDGFRVGLWK